MKKLRYLLVAVIALSFIAVPNAFSVDFSGKTIEWIIPFDVGGGSDVWARLYAPFMHKYLPGSPVVAVKNMPGGGSITGANHFASRAKPDGLTVLGSSGSTIIPYLLKNPRVKYDFAKYPIVFATPVGGIAYINPKFNVKSAADLKGFKKELVFASQGATSNDIVPLLAFDILGLNVKAVFGYKGRGPGRVAFEQGEVTVDYQTTPAYIKNVRPLIKQGQAVPFLSWGMIDKDGNMVRDPVETDLPSLEETYELMHGKKPRGPAWNAWKALFIAGFAVQKAMWLPEKTPGDIVAAYVKAAEKTVSDPEFQKVAAAELGGYPQMVGPAARKAFDQVIRVSQKDRDWAINWLKTKYNVTIK